MKPLMILIALLCVGCGEYKQRTDQEIWENNLYRVKYGACDYIVFAEYKKGGVCHAGDCPNPIHKEKP